MTSHDQSSEGQSPEAGWYPDPESDGTRYWDGAGWTEQRMPASRPAPPVAHTAVPPEEVTPRQTPASPPTGRSGQTGAAMPDWAKNRPRRGTIACVAGLVVIIAAILIPHNPDYWNGGAYVKNDFWTLTLIAGIAALGFGLFYIYRAGGPGSTVPSSLPRIVVIATVICAVLGVWMVGVYAVNQYEFENQQQELFGELEDGDGMDQLNDQMEEAMEGALDPGYDDGSDFSLRP